MILALSVQDSRVSNSILNGSTGK
ncbi:hypothetical protein F383_07884 [Gossypium arboreum]|uniref:Uncharacterized protein n=1 Tax=Gossypium arboreum TaxID=29729 RepID=A0A0B0PI23_GOSAR|nr:hypothetical protein F383_07884 [Gossypium arboreum]